MKKARQSLDALREKRKEASMYWEKKANEYAIAVQTICQAGLNDGLIVPGSYSSSAVIDSDELDDAVDESDQKKLKTDNGKNSDDARNRVISLQPFDRLTPKNCNEVPENVLDDRKTTPDSKAERGTLVLPTGVRRSLRKISDKELSFQSSHMFQSIVNGSRWNFFI